MFTRDIQPAALTPAADRRQSVRPESSAFEGVSEAPGAVAGIAQRAGTPSPRLSPRDVLQLQRTVGNRAVGRLLGQEAVQRVVTFNKPPTVKRDDTPAVEGYINDLDTAVERARMYVLHVPTLGKYRDLDGHTEHWAELWKQYQETGTSALMAAAFGYAVESLATLVYLPPAPPGMDIELQGSRAGTRPDVILKQSANDVAWLDITSVGSGGHIWNKAHWNKAVIQVAEVAYPAMNLVDFNPTPDYDDKVDRAEFEKRMYWARYLLNLRREAWKALGNGFKPPRVRDRVLAENTLPGKAVEQIQQYFGVLVDKPTAASVLYAMGGPSKVKSFHLNYSVSRSRGESFLLQHDPNLPTIEIPGDGPPRAMPLSQEYRAELAKLVVQDDWEDASFIEEEHNYDTGIMEERKEDTGIEEEYRDDTVNIVENSGETEMMGMGGSQPLATYEFQLPGMPRVTDQLLESVGDYLMQNQFRMAIHLDFGSFQSSIFTTPGSSFAEDFRAAMANFGPMSSSAFDQHGNDQGESSIGPIRERRIRVRVELFPYHESQRPRHRIEGLPRSLLRLMGTGDEMGNLDNS